MKDAFLTVAEVERVLIQVPSWVHNVMQAPLFWILKKCLPGQRNAAMRWSDKFRSVSGQRVVLNNSRGRFFAGWK